MPFPQSDLVVIGAGLAGLHTAWRLQQQGRSCLVLEGRQRAGGRIAAGDAELGVDLGPTWFWPHQPMMGALLEELGLEQFDQYTRGDVLYESAPGQAPMRHAGAGTPLSHRVAGGMQALIDALSSRISPGTLLFDHAVRNAERTSTGWRLEVDAAGAVRTFETRTLIAALPPRLLAGALSAERWASAGLLRALRGQQTWMSAQAKFVAEFATPFWREQGLSGDAFSRVGPLVEIHDATDEHTGKAALFGFIGVPAASRSSVKPDELEAACARQLVQLFGKEASDPVRTYLMDWAREPFTVSDADIGELPAHADFPLDEYQRELAALALLPAGSEFAQHNPGYLEGALEASERCLQELNREASISHAV